MILQEQWLSHRKNILFEVRSVPKVIQTRRKIDARKNDTQMIKLDTKREPIFSLICKQRNANRTEGWPTTPVFVRLARLCLLQTRETEVRI